ncbi:hypothetical protein [Burkholderia paludis]|uniref:hypothetical protein n=1 Tax=Burkholderia paludis TaxID=1506587 RepID=UPI000ABB43EA|nr:hypothetical protein [Burkholderia paludis]
MTNDDGNYSEKSRANRQEAGPLRAARVRGTAREWRGLKKKRGVDDSRAPVA